jgi:hypothetical protein
MTYALRRRRQDLPTLRVGSWRRREGVEPHESHKRGKGK